jgi:hypothetical protein
MTLNIHYSMSSYSMKLSDSLLYPFLFRIQGYSKGLQIPKVTKFFTSRLKNSSSIESHSLGEQIILSIICQSKGNLRKNRCNNYSIITLANILSCLYCYLTCLKFFIFQNSKLKI